METLNVRQIQDKDGFCVTVFIRDGSDTANYDVFFIAPFPCEVIKVMATYRATSVNGFVGVEKLTSGQANGSGLPLLKLEFNTTLTINTPQTKKGTALESTGAQILKEGDRLGLVADGTLTNLAGLQLTLFLTPLGKGHYQVS